MVLPVNTEAPGKIRGCLLKFFDCWKSASCSLRALSTETGCCCHCQPGEAATQLNPTLAVFWLKIREMRMPTCRDTKPSKVSAHRKLLCPSYQPCSHLWSTTFPPEHPTNHKGQLMSTSVSKILCSTLVVPMALVLKWLLDQNIVVFDCFKCKTYSWDMSMT